jgi:competence protein ComEC
MIHRALPVILILCCSCGPDPLDAPPADEDEISAAARPDARLVASESALRRPLLRITAFDVGQGDGLLVQFPGGATLAIDGGPDDETFAEYLGRQGIGHLDVMVLSHAHDDHYRGLPAAMALLPGDCGRRVLDPGYASDKQGYQAFRAAAGCRYRALTAGQRLYLDPAVEVQVLHATRRLDPEDDSHGVNNTSVVLRIRYGRFSMLLTGDAEVEAERELWQAQGFALRSTVLKAGHHGSCNASATTFLKAVRPQYVLISAGRGNSYGLPHCQTVRKLAGLRAQGTRWARTDVNGTLSVATDGSSYTIRTSRGRDSQTTCPRECADPQDF